MTQEEILSYLYELRDKFKKEATNAMTRDYYIYKEASRGAIDYYIYKQGSRDAIEKVIKKINS